MKIRLWKDHLLTTKPGVVKVGKTRYYAAEKRYLEEPINAEQERDLGSTLYAALPISVRESLPRFIDSGRARVTDSDSGIIMNDFLTADELAKVAEGYIYARAEANHRLHRL